MAVRDQKIRDLKTNRTGTKQHTDHSQKIQDTVNVLKTNRLIRSILQNEMKVEMTGKPLSLVYALEEGLWALAD